MPPLAAIAPRKARSQRNEREEAGCCGYGLRPVLHKRTTNAHTDSQTDANSDTDTDRDTDADTHTHTDSQTDANTDTDTDRDTDADTHTHTHTCRVITDVTHGACGGWVPSAH